MASPQRPSTPLSQVKKLSRRHSHRSSGVYNVLSHSPKIHYPIDADKMPLETATNTEKFERLSDAFEELDANMTNLQLIHEAISEGFNESFASFLYGLSITMWCVDFPDCPSKDQWDKIKYIEEVDYRISKLRNQISKIKSENELMKEQLTSASREDSVRVSKKQTTSTRTARTTKSEQEPKSAPPDTQSMRKESNVNTRIPQPVKNNFKKQITNPVGTTTPQSTSQGPNLNQPPRYMRGLFEHSKKNETTSKKKNSKGIRNRPPFR